MLDLVPSGDYFFAGADRWQLNADAALRLGRIQALYIGGGYGIGDIDNGPNLLVGLEAARRLPSRPIHGYLEGRWTFGVTARFHLLLGINFLLGKTRTRRPPRG